MNKQHGVFWVAAIVLLSVCGLMALSVRAQNTVYFSITGRGATKPITDCRREQSGREFGDGSGARRIIALDEEWLGEIC
jgi:hypothetical protein